MTTCIATVARLRVDVDEGRHSLTYLACRVFVPRIRLLVTRVARLVCQRLQGIVSYTYPQFTFSRIYPNFHFGAEPLLNGLEPHSSLRVLARHAGP